MLKTDSMMVSASDLVGPSFCTRATRKTILLMSDRACDLHVKEALRHTHRKAKGRKKDKSQGGEVMPPPGTDPGAVPCLPPWHVLKTDGQMMSASGLPGPSHLYRCNLDDHVSNVRSSVCLALEGFGANRKAKRRKKDKSGGGEVMPPPRADP